MPKITIKKKPKKKITIKRGKINIKNAPKRKNDNIESVIFTV